jgi:hypothetical protein
MYEPHKVAYRHPKYKTAYRVKNWPEYEKSLRDRGDITIWFSQEAIEAWTPKKNGKRGGQPVYSNIAIETSLSLRLIFQLPLRQTEGFLGSLLRLMRLDLPCPDHTTLSRRNQTIDVQRNIDKLPDGPVCFIVDSTGLKICGQGYPHIYHRLASILLSVWAIRSFTVLITPFRFFGLVDGYCRELGYFVLSELEEIRGPMGLQMKCTLALGIIFQMIFTSPKKKHVNHEWR